MIVRRAKRAAFMLACAAVAAALAGIWLADSRWGLTAAVLLVATIVALAVADLSGS